MWSMARRGGVSAVLRCSGLSAGAPPCLPCVLRVGVAPPCARPAAAASQCGMSVNRAVHGSAALGTPHTARTRPVAWLRKYVFGRYLQYLRGFQALLESEFPRAFRLYRVFTVGVKHFLADVKEYAVIARNVHRSGLQCLSRRQLELYFQQPRDMTRVAPVILVAALPLAQNVVFPLAWLFPRQLLCRHFWSLQQRAQFDLHDHRRRLLFFRPVFRHLQARTQYIGDAACRAACRRALSVLGSGGALTAQQVLQMSHAFAAPGPFALHNLSSIQVRRLLKLHNLSVLTMMRRRALREHADLLRHMDAAMLREGIPDMSLEELYYACYLRGLSPQNLPREELASWLAAWSRVSTQLEPAAGSLLLHCPVLLGYNQPSNWVVLH